MLKKTIEYKDLEDNTVVEDFYFNLSKADIAEMELSKKGGLVEYLQSIVKAESGAEIISAFRAILTKAIGQKHEDGVQFVKNDAIRERFLNSDAYSVLFMQLISDEAASSEFMNGVVPKDLAQSVADMPTPAPATPAPKALKDMTDEELAAHLEGKHPKDMSHEELVAGMRLKTKA